MHLKTTRLFLLAALLNSASALAQSDLLTQPVQDFERAALFPTKTMLEQGKTIAQANCASCHGVDGLSPDTQLPHLAGQRAVYLFRVLQAYQDGYRIDQSMGHNSGFLNNEGLLSVSAYYANLTPYRREEAGEEPVELENLASSPFESIQDDMKKCVKCHNEDGNATSSGMPNLTAQDPEYFRIAMEAYANGDRQHRMMKRLVGDITPETISAMGVFYAVQVPLPTTRTGNGDEALGRVLAEDCAVCHGDDGNTQAADVPSLAGQDPKYFVKAMEAYRDGERKHQGMFDAVDDLSDTDFENLATFYAARTPTRRDVRMPFTAAEWIDRCVRCHGLDGNSTDPRFPMLAAQNEDYLRRSLKAYSSGDRRINTTMHAMSATLTDSDIANIAAYFASREAKSVVYIDLPCEGTN